MSARPTLAIVGGTGALGSGLALRWAAAGYRVVIGSRDAAKGAAVAAGLEATLAARGRDAQIEVADNRAAAAAGDIVVLAVAFGHQRTTLEAIRAELAGKILVDVTVPLVPPKVMRVQLPPEGSAGQIAQALLGEPTRVVSAFQNVAATHLQGEGPVPCDVLVCGDDRDARQQVIALVEAAGARGLHGGSIANAAAAEALTSVLIFLNKEYGGHSGIRISGLDGDHG